MSKEHPLWANGPRVSREHVVSHLTSFPEQESYTDKIAHELSHKVIGQEQAMKAIARRIAIADAGFNDPDRPLSVMLFMGPTGVGKTESAKALAECIYDGDDEEAKRHLQIIDCSEFSEEHMVIRLTGAPPSYVGYNNETQIQEGFLNTRNVIVFDEIEKAHPALHRLLLGVMESGRLSVHNGKQLNFANSHLIFTSNIGAREMQQLRKGNQRIGFTDESVKQNPNVESVGKRALYNFFKNTPEFLGRIDEIVVFNDLEDKDYDEIYWKFIEEKNKQIYDRFGYSAPYITTTVEAKDYLLNRINKQFGARDVRGVIDRHVFQSVADKAGIDQIGGKAVVIDIVDDNNILYIGDFPEYENALWKQKYTADIEEESAEIDSDISDDTDTDSDNESIIPL